MNAGHAKGRALSVVAVGVTAAFVLACRGSTPEDTAFVLCGDTGCFYGATKVQELRYDCDATDATWRYEALLDGTGSKVLLDVQRGDGPLKLAEHAEMPSVAVAADGSWDQHVLELPIVGGPAQRDGESTSFSCDQRDALTYRIRVWDADGAPSDCVAWGPGAGAFTGCTLWTP